MVDEKNMSYSVKHIYALYIYTLYTYAFDRSTSIGVKESVEYLFIYHTYNLLFSYEYL